MIDDADDKKMFYESLSKIYNSKQTMQQPINIDLISNKIDSRLNQLDKLYRTLNTPTEFEDTPLDLYKYYNSLKAIVAKVDDKSSIIMTNVSRRVMSLSTQKIKEICAYYQHGDLIESFIKYEDISKQYPWLAPDGDAVILGDTTDSKGAVFLNSNHWTEYKREQQNTTKLLHSKRCPVRR